MSLIFCPECGHEVSVSAVACPNCGRPMAVQPSPVVERKVVAMPTPVRREGFPPWAFVPIGLLAVILIVVMYVAFRNNSEDNANVNVNVNSQRRASLDNRESRNVTVPPTSESQPVSMPPSSSSVPSTTTTTTVPGTATAPPQALPDKSAVSISARVVTSSGSTQPAKGTKFYLLDRDLESILSQARVEPIEGNTLSASLGLASVYPDRYADFQRAAMRAIASHVKYSGTTSTAGNTDLKNIQPGEYYLFGLTRVGHGFALWDAPVSVTPGSNVMNLRPQDVTDIPDTTG